MRETDFAYEPDFRVLEMEKGLERHYECVRAGGGCRKAFGYIVKSFEKEG